MAIQSGGRSVSGRELSRPGELRRTGELKRFGEAGIPARGRVTVAAILLLVGSMGVLGSIVGFSSQAFIAVEVGAIAAMLGPAVRIDPGRYRRDRSTPAGEAGQSESADAPE